MVKHLPYLFIFNYVLYHEAFIGHIVLYNKQTKHRRVISAINNCALTSNFDYNRFGRKTTKRFTCSFLSDYRN